jgi:leader peptidase (prepilin peptidase) / N-methyltransferase
VTLDPTTLAGGLAGLAVGTVPVSVALELPATGPPRRPSLATVQRHRAATTVGVLACGGVGAGTAVALNGSLVLPAYWLCGLLSVALVITDLRCRRLPYALTGSLYGTTGVAILCDSAVTLDARSLVTATGAAAVTLTMFLLLALLAPGQVALGDVVLLGWVALSLGWFGYRVALLGILTGLLIAAVIALGLVAVRRATSAIPLAPALLCGWLTALLFATS